MLKVGKRREGEPGFHRVLTYNPTIKCRNFAIQYIILRLLQPAIRKKLNAGWSLAVPFPHECFHFLVAFGVIVVRSNRCLNVSKKERSQTSIEPRSTRRNPVKQRYS